MSPTDMDAGRSSSRGGFFMIDRRSWIWTCQLGLNEGVAYLVLARGTGPDNRTTSWSVDAIERYTGISRARAKSAIASLKAAGAIDQTDTGTRPKYVLRKAHELPRPAVTDGERKAVRKSSSTKKALTAWEHQQAESAVKKGAAVFKGGRFDFVPDPTPEPEWIWLPNELVTGAAGEIPPVELIRQSRDAMMLRLLVELYAVQDLVCDGGIGRGLLRQEYERLKVGQQGAFTVWAFSRPRSWVTWTPVSTPHRREGLQDGECGKDWFSRIETLTGLGLLEWVPHVFEGDDATAELIHPCGMGESTSLEDRLGAAAHHAGREMITEGQVERATNEMVGDPWFVPVPHHIAQVRMIGVARLRYRPKTARTAAWFAEQQKLGESWIERYCDLIRTKGLSAAAA